MTDASTALDALVSLSRWLGDPARDLAIIGEGNASARLDESTFLVKESGKGMSEADASSFVAVGFEPILAAFERETMTDDEVRNVLLDARIGCTGDRPRPSVETFLHAFLLSLPDVRFVGHTHPTAVNAILCSAGSREAVSGRLFPDEIVCCGPAVCYVEYTDPGIPLARKLREAVLEFGNAHNMAPRVILMENHGLIATGASVRDVQTATAMYVKTARILAGTAAFGGPRFLSEENVARIHTRPDESYRQRLIAQRN